MAENINNSTRKRKPLPNGVSISFAKWYIPVTGYTKSSFAEVQKPLLLCIGHDNYREDQGKILLNNTI